MAANERLTWKNARSKLTKLASKWKESGNHVESASSKEEVVSIDNNSTQNVAFQSDIEGEPNIDFNNTFEVPNLEDEPSIDFNDAPKLPIINNVVNCATETSNNKSLCSKLFIKKNYFENFCDEYLQFKYYVQSKRDSESQQIENKSDYKNQILKNKINHLVQEIINLKKINEDLKSHLKMIETLSEGNPIDAPWQTTSSKTINNSNRTILSYSSRKLNICQCNKIREKSNCYWR